MRKDNWICDCKSPLPDIMSYSERECKVCGMKYADIKKRIKATNNTYALRRYCKKCSKICMNRRHQSIMYRASLCTYWDRDKEGVLIQKYSQAGLKILEML